MQMVWIGLDFSNIFKDWFGLISALLLVRFSLVLKLFSAIAAAVQGPNFRRGATSGTAHPLRAERCDC
jgi:hypothetical protein